MVDFKKCGKTNTATTWCTFNESKLVTEIICLTLLISLGQFISYDVSSAILLSAIYFGFIWDAQLFSLMRVKRLLENTNTVYEIKVESGSFMKAYLEYVMQCFLIFNLLFCATSDIRLLQVFYGNGIQYLIPYLIDFFIFTVLTSGYMFISFKTQAKMLKRFKGNATPKLTKLTLDLFLCMFYFWIQCSLIFG